MVESQARGPPVGAAMDPRFTILRLMLVIAALALEFGLLPFPIALAAACLTPIVIGLASQALLDLSCVTIAFGIVLALIMPAVRPGHHRNRCSVNMRQIARALGAYHDEYGCFPPAYVVDGRGRPAHSWRVLILPYLGREDLYFAYNFSERWDGPGNRTLIPRMPSAFACETSEDTTSGHTSYLAIAGAGTAFPGAKSSDLGKLGDGVSRTIMVAEVAESGVLWTEPRDMDIATMSFHIDDAGHPSISSRRHERPAVAFADGQVQRLDRSMKPETLRALVTIHRGDIRH